MSDKDEKYIYRDERGLCRGVAHQARKNNPKAGIRKTDCGKSASFYMVHCLECHCDFGVYFSEVDALNATRYCNDCAKSRLHRLGPGSLRESFDE